MWGMHADIWFANCQNDGTRELSGGSIAILCFERQLSRHQRRVLPEPTTFEDGFVLAVGDAVEKVFPGTPSCSSGDLEF
jgi:hypothetical protein